MQCLRPLLDSELWKPSAEELCGAQLRRLFVLLLKGSEFHEHLEAVSVFLEAPVLPKESSLSRD